MDKIRQIVFGGLFIAIGIVLSLLFHSLGGTQLGSRLLPLHFTVILAGLLLGQWMGLAVGALLPLISNFTIGMPPLSPPIAIFMMPELATYGFVAGYLSRKGVNIYINILITVISGRVMYAASYYVIGKMVQINLQPIVALILSFASGIIGVVIQFVLIPPLYLSLRKYFKKSKT